MLRKDIAKKMGHALRIITKKMLVQDGQTKDTYGHTAETMEYLNTHLEIK